MNTQEAIKILRNTAWLGTNENREKTEQAVEVVAEALDQDKIIYCKDCKFKRGLGYEGHYYCALEDRPNRNWSVVETDFCSWAERQEPKRGEKAKTLFMNLYNCEKFENLSNGVVYMKIPKCSIYDEIGREWIVNCVRQDNFECCFTHAFEQVERIEGERSQNCVKCKHYCEIEDDTGVHSQCRATCSNNTQVDKLRKAAEETEDNGVRKGILKAIEVLEGDTE